MKRERKKPKEEIKEGIKTCAAYLKGVPLSARDRTALMNACVKDWLAMAPEKRLEIQAQCTIQAKDPATTKSCTGFKTLNPDIPLTVSLQNDIKQLAQCEAGKLQAPDLKTKREFAEWCFAQIQPASTRPNLATVVSKGEEDFPLVKEGSFFKDASPSKVQKSISISEIVLSNIKTMGMKDVMPIPMIAPLEKGRQERIVATVRKLLPVLKNTYKVLKIGLFGLYVGEDVGFLAEFAAHTTYFTIAGLALFLEEQLQEKVHITTANGLGRNPELLKEALKGIVYL